MLVSGNNTDIASPCSGAAAVKAVVYIAACAMADAVNVPAVAG